MFACAVQLAPDHVPPQWPDPADAQDFRVFADPAGHPFCLVFDS